MENTIKIMFFLNKAMKLCELFELVIGLIDCGLSVKVFSKFDYNVSHLNHWWMKYMNKVESVEVC